MLGAGVLHRQATTSISIGSSWRLVGLGCRGSSSTGSSSALAGVGGSDVRESRACVPAPGRTHCSVILPGHGRAACWSATVAHVAVTSRLGACAVTGGRGAAVFAVLAPKRVDSVAVAGTHPRGRHCRVAGLLGEDTWSRPSRGNEGEAACACCTVCDGGGVAATLLALGPAGATSSGL